MPKETRIRPQADRLSPYEKSSEMASSQKTNIQTEGSRVTKSKTAQTAPREFKKSPEDPIVTQEYSADADEPSQMTQGKSISRPKALQEQSANIIPPKPAAKKDSTNSAPNSFSISEIPVSTSSSGQNPSIAEKKDLKDDVVPMTDEERRRIYNKKCHWQRAMSNVLYHDVDLLAFAEEERRVEDHTFVLRGLAAEVADEGDDNDTVIAKLKAAGGWFGDLTLRGEEDKTVPIYDTCVRLRDKLADFLGPDKKKPENLNVVRVDGKRVEIPFTKSTFCAHIGTTTASLSSFMKKEGTMAGAENGTYVKAYCFLEKKRLWEGAEKSDAREACEYVWWPKGLQLRDSNRGITYYVPVDAGPITTYINENSGEMFPSPF